MISRVWLQDAGNMLRTPFDLVELPPPGFAIPDLEVIVDPGDNDFPLEAGVAEQGSRNHDPSLLVQLRLGRAGEEMALQLAAFAAERIETRDARLEPLLPVLPRVCIQAAVHAARDDDAAGHGVSEPGRKGEPVLVVDGVFVLSKQHVRAISSLHFLPL